MNDYDFGNDSENLMQVLEKKEYLGLNLGSSLPDYAEAWKIYDIYNIMMGFYGKNGFKECCLESNAEYNLLKSKNSQSHLVKDSDNLLKMVNGTNEYALKYFNNFNANKLDFMILLSSIKYPGILGKFFKSKDLLKKAYKKIPWNFNDCLNFDAFNDYASKNSVYKFLEKFPVNIYPKCFWLKDEDVLGSVLGFVEKEISYGVMDETFGDIWDYVKKEMPKAFGFSNECSFLDSISKK